MEKDCISYCKKYETLLNDYPIIKTLVLQLVNNEEQLSLAITLQNNNDPGGHIESKNIRFDVLVNDCYRFSRLLSLLAKETGNTVLLKDVNLSKTDFYEGGEEKTLLRCAKVLSRGTEYMEQLIQLGANQKQVDMMKAECEKLKQVSSTVGLVNNDRKMATQKIKSLIVDARGILDKFDDAFEALIGDQDMLNGWFAIRKIKGRHHSSTKVNETKA